MHLAQYQAAMARYLRAPDPQSALDALGPAFADAQGRDQARLRVYRNNRFVALIDNLAKAYPSVQAVVGEEFFNALAHAFLHSDPEIPAVMAEFGAGFSDFLAGFKPLSHLEYLPDLARLERAFQTVRQAKAVEPLGADALAGLDEAALHSLCVQRVPALEVLALAWPVLDLWSYIQGDQSALPPTMEAGAYAVVVYRAHAGTVAAPLKAVEYQVLDRLAAAGPLGEHIVDAVSFAHNYDPGQFLMTLLHQGWLMKEGQT